MNTHRQKVEVIKEYLLLSENDINAYNNLVIVNINSDSSNGGRQFGHYLDAVSRCP